jgi:hypothetical protein
MATCLGTVAGVTRTRALATLTASLCSLVLLVPAGASAELGLPVVDEALQPLQSVIQPVVDEAGQLIGTVDQTTGQVIGTAGEVIGTLDPATGEVLDPVGNVIGTVLPPATLPGDDSNGGGSTGGGTVPEGQAPMTGAPLSLSFSAPRVQRFRTAGRRGIATSARCSRSCGVAVALTVTRGAAKRLGLGKQQLVGTASVKRSGRMSVKLGKRSKRLVARYLSAGKRRRTLRLTVLAVAFDASGVASSVRQRTVILKG